MKSNLTTSEIEALKAPMCELIQEDAASRAIELVMKERPHLAMDLPFILIIAQVFHQRKLKEMGL